MISYLGLSEHVGPQLPPPLQNVTSLLRGDVYLQRRRDGGADEAVDDGGDFLLDGGLFTVGVTEILRGGENE